MTSSRRSPAGHDLVKAVGYWLRMEEANPELKSRVASALDDIRAFVEKYRAQLEKRRGRLVQTSGFKEETRSMEAALDGIHRLLACGRNISAIFAEIDGFLDRFQADETFAREHTRVQLAEAREDFLRAFHESIRGTRLAELLDILYFMPYSCWRSRGVETRNFRSPSAAEVLRLLEELGSRGVDVNGVAPVQLAAVIRVKLGITPRMDYHLLPANKLAEQLTGKAAVSRFTSREVPLDESLCRAAGRVLEDLRRWSAQCFGSGSPPVPAELEAEMVQVALLSADTVRLGGTGGERASDYLWLVSTVVACAGSPLRDALSELSGRSSGSPAVLRRLAEARAYVDETAVLADGILLPRWSEAREELGRLAARAGAIAGRSTHEFGQLTELDALKEKRSEVVKSLIKISDSLQLLEPTLQELLTLPALPAMGPSALEAARALDPAQLKSRNRTIAEETRRTARREFESLRSLIARMTAISRRGLADSAAQSEQERLRAGGNRARRAADGAEMGELSAAELHERLGVLLRKAALSLREFKGKAEGARKRAVKGDLQHVLFLLGEKVRSACEACDGSSPDTPDPDRSTEACDRLVPPLREVMAALTGAGTRVGVAKLSPAEKQPLLTLLYAAKAKLGDDLRDMERLRAEISERLGGPQGERSVASAARSAAAEEPPQAAGEAPMAAPEAEPAGPEAGGEAAAAREIAALVSAAGRTLKPVRDLAARLDGAISAGKRDSRAAVAAAGALKGGIAEARDLVTWSLGEIRSGATARGPATGAALEKLERWNDQLLALGRETERLLEAAHAVAALEAAARAAVALDTGIAETVKLLSVQDVGAGDLLPLRDRCTGALETLETHFGQLRRTRECLAGAARADWRVLKSVPEYLEARRSGLAAVEAGLQAGQARIRRVLDLLHTHWKLPASGGGRQPSR